MTDPHQPESMPDITADRANEYLVQMQHQLDALTGHNRALRERVTKLEADRQILRDRLSAERARIRLRPNRTSDPAPTEPEHVPTNTPAPPPRVGMRVAAITDTFTAATLATEWDMTNIHRATWEAEIAQLEPELLFVESAFAGIGDSWVGELARFGRPSETLVEVVQWCSQRSIPTVFWNKEDPINFEMFLATARLFDYVFTVDADSFELYKRHVPNIQVGLMSFAAQPAMHFAPPSIDSRINGVAFAGSYYGVKHPERRAQMELILDPARSLGLDIYSRNSGSDVRFRWPDKYQEHVRASLSYTDTMEVYRIYKVALNVNTVTGSSTMCSRRIFELLACGAYVVSGPSAAFGSIVPNELVRVATTKDEAADLIKEGLTNPMALEKAAAAGPAWAMAGQTYADRIDGLLADIGLGNHR